jgi:hypothetical protein
MKEAAMQWTVGLLLLCAAIVSAQPAATDTAGTVAASATATGTTATATDTPSEVEADVLKWLNIARTEPQVFREALREMLPKFDKSNPMLYHIENDPVALLTNEGRIPVIEAMKALHALEKAGTKLRPLSFADGLNRCARDHAVDQGTHGLYSHTGSDGTSAWDRIRRYGGWKRKAAENMCTGFNSGLDIVRYLIVDDGEPDRSHRINILSPDFERVGISVQPHKLYDWLVVMDFTGPFVDNHSLPKLSPIAEAIATKM